MGNKIEKVAKTATTALVFLWEEGFFKAWKTVRTIDTHLGKRGNNFSPPELGMALMRAKYLTRKGKKGSYEYIQKYPYVAESIKPPVSKRK